MANLDLNAHAEALARQSGRTFMAPVIEKELLHYEILRTMSEHGLLQGLVFQGGTCLRLCYGAPRYSEDLDFAGGTNFDAANLGELKRCLELTLPRRYPIAVEVSEPKEADALVKKWRIRIDTTMNRADIAKQRISLEVASIPAYTKEPRMLLVNYESLPSSYADVIVQAESPSEILADKLESFICASHLRYRDIWDMFWLKRRPSIDVAVAQGMRARKALDYGEQAKYAKRKDSILEELPQIVESMALRDQLKRFLPLDLFENTVARADFRTLMAQGIEELYDERA